MLHLTECTQRIRTDGLCCHGRILRILSKWINRTNDLSDSICSTPDPYLRPCVVAYQMDGIVPFHLEIPTLSSNLGRGDYIYQSHMAESIKYTMAKAPRWPRQTLWGTRSASWEKEAQKSQNSQQFPRRRKNRERIECGHYGGPFYWNLWHLEAPKPLLRFCHQWWVLTISKWETFAWKSKLLTYMRFYKLCRSVVWSILLNCHFYLTIVSNELSFLPNYSL